MIRHRRALAALAAALVLGSGGAAGAQVLFGDERRVVEDGTLGVVITGQVVVTYAGPDGERGTMVADPSSATTLDWFRTRSGARTRLDGFLSTGPEEDPQLRVVSERGTAPDVQRCSDAVPAYQLLEVSGGHGLTVRALPRSAFARGALRTRCGGPLAADLGPLPAASVDLATLRKGGRTLDLRARRAFAGGGYTGVVRSTVRIRLGGPYDDGGQRAFGVDEDPLPGVLTARYRVRSLEGRVDVALRGAEPQAVCGPLDSCGATGTLTVRPSASAGTVAFLARARDGAGPAALRAAFGAGPGPAARDVRVFGAGLLRGPGQVDAIVDRADGSRCVRAGRTGPGSLEFGTRRGRLHAIYSAVGLQSRCPGPLLQQELARGSVPLRALRRSTVTIPLTGGRAQADDGWRAVTRPALVLRLERRAVRVEPKD